MSEDREQPTEQAVRCVRVGDRIEWLGDLASAEFTRLEAALAACRAERDAALAEAERYALLASVVTSQRLSGVEVSGETAARLLAEQERDAARADAAAARGALALFLALPRERDILVADRGQLQGILDTARAVLDAAGRAPGEAT